MAVIHLDGERIEVAEGSPLRTVLHDLPAGHCVALIRPAEKERAATGSLSIHTTAGEVRIEGEGDRAAFLLEPSAAGSLVLHWQDRHAAAFGPFPSGVSPVRKPSLYERGDVILGCGGYDPQRSYLIFSRSRHSSDHGADATGGVIGRVVAGRAVLDRWKTGDRIERIEPVISWADTSRSFTTTDLSTPLEDGMQVVTGVDMMAQGYTPEAVTTEAAGTVEHLLSTLGKNRFVVNRATSTHIFDAAATGTELERGHRHPRREGMVTVRTAGTSSGGIYIYREDVQSSPTHSIAGQVVHGIELVRLAKEGDVFSIRVRPERIDLLGLTLAQAQEIAMERGFTLHADSTDGSRMVVSQEPGTTLEVLKEKAATVTTAPQNRVVDIVLDDAKAPVTCALFRKVTGLSNHNAGALPLFFKFDDVFLFKPPIPPGAKIIPENTPAGEVPAASLAMTNDSRKGSGMAGVRLSANREFGPTSEPFEGTNVIGSIIDTEKLKGFKEREKVYIREVRR
ncbi:MAG TPA: methanogenesis marker 3 protein [Methanoregulaceae archaeon]|nr:methanogenesis marker 3 protein [Methanoregulaceae archaeon]